jgi:1-acyl-sn-glycerol-3-phosphate acyltransferase
MKDFEYKPARDHGLAPQDQLKSVQREAGLTAWCTQTIWRVLVRLYLRMYHRLEVRGAERIPASGPIVVVANHTSHLDALVLASALPWRLRQRAFPIAAGDVFFETPTVSLFSAMMLNALPMWRKKCGPHALQILRERLISEPALYILFPEGSRSRDGKMKDFKPGIGMMIAGTAAQVVPAHISGAWRAWRPGASMPSPRKVRVRFGSPMSFEGVPQDRAGWEGVSQALEDAVRELRPAARRSAAPHDSAPQL